MIELKFHDKSCYLCRYFRYHGNASECILLGRTLSINCDTYADRARYCDAFKKRPKGWWEINCGKNPHFDDKYIKRETLLNLRKKLKIENSNIRY